jgi:hypothetical protein
MVNYLIEIGYREKQLYNSYIHRKQQQQHRCELAREVVKGSHFYRHEITDDMIKFYLEMKEQDMFEADARREFHKKFGTSKSAFTYLNKNYGPLPRRPDHFLPGELNPMYNMEPDWKSGTGVKGHLLCRGKLIFFRSSLELRIYTYLIDNNIIFSLSKHRIHFEYEGKIKTYYPDIVIADCICEIKPTIKISWKDNIAKHEALKQYAAEMNLKCKYLTEKTYDLSFFTEDYFDKLLEDKIVIMEPEQIKRIKKYIKKWK